MIDVVLLASKEVTRFTPDLSHFLITLSKPWKRKKHAITKLRKSKVQLDLKKNLTCYSGKDIS